MAECETCGNDYDKAFKSPSAREKHVFDSFECAIHASAPTCPPGGCRIIGHGVEKQKNLLLRPLRFGGRRDTND